MNNPHAFILVLKAITECQCRCMGMVAENERSKRLDQHPLYVGKDFEEQISLMEFTFNQCRDHLT